MSDAEVDDDMDEYGFSEEEFEEEEMEALMAEHGIDWELEQDDYDDSDDDFSDEDDDVTDSDTEGIHVHQYASHPPPLSACVPVFGDQIPSLSRRPTLHCRFAGETNPPIDSIIDGIAAYGPHYAGLQNVDYQPISFAQSSICTHASAVAQSQTCDACAPAAAAAAAPCVTVLDRISGCRLWMTWPSTVRRSPPLSAPGAPAGRRVVPVCAPVVSCVVPDLGAARAV